MTKEELAAINRQYQWPEFIRLAKDLESIVLDFNYAKTRKALDPRWNEYDMPKDHDIAKTNADLLTEANLVTSRVRGLDGIHWPVLDLDWGAKEYPCKQGHNLSFNMKYPVWYGLDKHLFNVLGRTGLIYGRPPEVHRFGDGRGRLDIYTPCDFVLVDSSTPGHKHMIWQKNLAWGDYIDLLNVFTQCGILEAGYSKASIKKGFSAIRPPWVHKV